MKAIKQKFGWIKQKQSKEGSGRNTGKVKTKVEGPCKIAKAIFLKKWANVITKQLFKILGYSARNIQRVQFPLYKTIFCPVHDTRFMCQIHLPFDSTS